MKWRLPQDVLARHVDEARRRETRTDLTCNEKTLISMSLDLADAMFIVEAIKELRSDEGDALTFLCDPPFDCGDNVVIECVGEWTEWNERRFGGATERIALERAIAERRLTKQIADWPDLEPRATVNMLGLAGVDVDTETVSRWTKLQRHLANEWALAAYQQACGDDVLVPVRPDILPPAPGAEETEHD